MKSMITFFGSCGHVHQDEISNEAFERFIANENYHVEASDGSVRMIYVSPWRHTVCPPCAEEEALSDS